MWYNIYKKTDGNYHQRLCDFWSAKRKLLDNFNREADRNELPRGWYCVVASRQATGIVHFFYRGKPQHKHMINVGDAVRIIRDTCFHGYAIGSIQVIASAREYPGRIEYKIVGGDSFVLDDDIVLINHYPTEEDLGLT